MGTGYYKCFSKIMFEISLLSRLVRTKRKTISLTSPLTLYKGELVRKSSVTLFKQLFSLEGNYFLFHLENFLTSCWACFSKYCFTFLYLLDHSFVLNEIGGAYICGFLFFLQFVLASLFSLKTCMFYHRVGMITKFEEFSPVKQGTDI